MPKSNQPSLVDQINQINGTIYVHIGVIESDAIAMRKQLSQPSDEQVQSFITQTEYHLRALHELVRDRAGTLRSKFGPIQWRELWK